MIFKGILTGYGNTRTSEYLVDDTQTERYLNVPTFIFRDRTLAALESIVVYLKDSQGMTYAQIAKLLNRDDRTIWTTYTRAKKKLGGAK